MPQFQCDVVSSAPDEGMTVLEVADKLFEEARRGSRRCALCGGFGGGDRRGNVRRIGIAARFGGGYKGKDLGFGGIPGSGVPRVVAGLGQDATMLVVRMGGTGAHGTSHRRIEGAVVAGGIVGTDASHYLQAVARDLRKAATTQGKVLTRRTISSVRSSVWSRSMHSSPL